MCGSRIAVIPLVFTIEESADIRPNITGDIIVYTAMSGGNSASGAFTLYDGGGSGESSSYRSTRPKFSFSAFDSNAIYSGSTIQPVSSQALMIIKE